jgi:hypothetical protein
MGWKGLGSTRRLRISRVPLSFKTSVTPGRSGLPTPNLPEKSAGLAESPMLNEHEEVKR